MTISIGPIRFLRSASRNSATVFASKPARLAPRDAAREVVFAALRACCWRPRALPPFLAAAVRFAELVELRLAVLERELLDVLERFDPPDRLPLDRFDPPELPLLRRSAMLAPLLIPPIGDGLFPRKRDYLTS
jgi:hypothetical protein